MAAMEESMPVAAVPKRQSSAPGRRSEPMPWLKPGIFLGALTPLASIIWRAFDGGLSANPIAQIENELGLTALIFLVASLVCTPARRLFDWAWASRIRRELGLFAFFYAALHVLVYLLPDQLLDIPTILSDIAERPFITVGFLAFVLMVPLAWTSTNGAVRRLGFRRWQRLHYLVYLAGILAVIHFVWRVKIDVTQPMLYAVVLAALLAVRVAFWLRQRSAKPVAPAAGSNRPARTR
jgi:sulfoxide reductase heme-binding subunit YedZ